MKALLLLLAACGSSPSCPKAEQLGNAAEAKIMVERCRLDGWSNEVTDCLKAAKTEEATEPCLKKLDKAQKAKLKKAFAPLSAQYEAADKAGTIAQLADDIAGLHLDELVARDAACDAYKTAVNAARNAITKCSASAMSLEAFGMREKLRSDVAALRALPDAQLGAECAVRAKALSGLPTCQ